jgi:hypothetical protein
VARLQRFLPFVCAATVLVLFANADESTPVTKKKPGDAPETAEVRFADGSTVRMVLTQSTVEITTRYGKLSVPVSEIRRIEFGFRYPEGVQAKIEAAIGKLSSGDTKVRDAAAQDLLGFRELAYPPLKRAAVGTDAELGRRAREVIRKLEDKVGAEKLKIRDLDTIHAAEFIVSGKIEAPTLGGRTTYFGEVTVQVAEVRTIRFLAGPGAEVEIVVEAAKYAATSQDQWLDTEVDVAEGATLEIVAAGQVDLWPQGGNYKTGPDAQPRQGTSPDGNPSGMLLGRIGERGKVFQIGSKYLGPAGEAGRLYLRIACSSWNNPSTGGYGVKINPNADADGSPAIAPPPIRPKRPAGPAKGVDK